MMPPRSPLITELLEDIERGKILPCTSVKNIESVLVEFVHEYQDYDHMIRDLEEFNYVKIV